MKYSISKALLGALVLANTASHSADSAGRDSQELAFLHPYMKKHFANNSGVGPSPNIVMMVAASSSDVNPERVSGKMNIKEALQIDVNSDMSEKDYKACSRVMSICKNMVQKTLVEAAAAEGVKTADALVNMDAWVDGYVNFPFPFFNFRERQSDKYEKSEFSLKVNTDVVEAIVNVKNVPNLKDAVFKALKANSGELGKYSKQKRDFKYFGNLNAYKKDAIETRVIKFSMHMEKTDVSILCGSTSKTNLNTSYDTFLFDTDKELMIKMQEKMQDKLDDYFADKLLQFMKDFYDRELIKFKDRMREIVKKMKNS